MNRIATTNRKVWAVMALIGSTLLSYAKLFGVVVSERLWQIPQRQLRTTSASRRMP
jgi:hypothetical protein